ncbi:hypothetical protein HMPREF1985_02087 [Mitsuokella sp. oral taxon 131 str. W9106]|nr:hypothetical protein HMPREF1985_02087 [Mitsuokella sp. oral taxon 131 str. W9106]
MPASRPTTERKSDTGWHQKRRTAKSAIRLFVALQHVMPFQT